MSTRSDIRCTACAQFLCLSGDLPDWLWWRARYKDTAVPVCAECYDAKPREQVREVDDGAP